MTTRGKSGIIKPNPKYAYVAQVQDIPNEPKTVKSALKYLGWLNAMQEELEALHPNNTWDLVPYFPKMHVIGSKWVFKTKLKVDGTLELLKARLVAKGYNQVESVDFSETFSPVIKLTTSRIVLSVAEVKGWDIRQLDVKNAFLHGKLQELVYMTQPLDTDWAGCPATKRSTIAFYTFIGSNCISWSAKKQQTIARSSEEAKYRAMASTTVELTWLSYILCDIGLHLPQPITLFCDNMSALHMSINPIFHARTKHIEIDYYYVYEQVALGLLITRFISLD
ncbi:hypothetical protein SLEP1_g11196 [Rubroshorea leprosula]|uniref:Reverse transcriptase Ty1/copia-type domain-containing protein n=1 Tax=Rubroshorea leprosula TaxID=152421 RepID=A0AAV5IK00_9ROSI|nr:hypothetical protein SLEP1_g11196 [Rubroshorea leprosula]